MASGVNTELLINFVAWVHTHLDGDEKSEAQIYMDRFFQAFGWLGLKEAGATCETRVKNDQGGTAFADLVWKPIVLIEMKKRKTNLSKHYRQAFDYWAHLAPGRPRYAVLCNFDEFWIYDFETQLDSPVDIVRLVDLPTRFGPLTFLSKKAQAPVFGNHHESVSRQAADRLAECFTSILKRSHDRDLAQRFTLQLLMALFSQDIGLLERYFVTRLLNECETPAQTYDALGGLFDAMNRRNGNPGGRFKGVQYFNGGLFVHPARIELKKSELSILKEVSNFDWSKVSPEIFGTLFEHCLQDKERSAFGVHFTSLLDIMKIVTPTIVEPWSAAIEGATTLARLRELLIRLQRFTVLDPACGSGNFLYIAYREIKRLEALIYAKMANDYKSVDANQRPFGFVTVKNFFGIDINPVAIAIAKVTMTLAHKLAIEELHISETALPLDNLDKNFWVKDALVDEKGEIEDWPKTDVIIGNPPFLGARRLKPFRGRAYAERLRGAYPETPGQADYCVYWFWKANEKLADCTIDDPFTGRAGLVGTQNIRSSQHRTGSLDHIVESGTIIDAVDNQPWSGEANVNVSIVNWIKTKNEKILPPRKLWSKVDLEKSVVDRGAKRLDPRRKDKQSDIALSRCSSINSSLTAGIDTSSAKILVCNTKPQRVFQGVTPGHAGFVLTPAERASFVRNNASVADVTFPYLIGSELVGATGAPKRFLIDFQPLSLPEASGYGDAYTRVEKRVLRDRLRKVGTEGEDVSSEVGSHHKGFLKRWWRLSWERSDMVGEIKKLRGARYIVCSRVTKRPIFAFVSKDIRPGDRLQTFMFEDDYSFGILQSKYHWAWFTSRCPKQLERFIYTTQEVFDTFPWPQDPSAYQVKAVAEAAVELRSLRQQLLPKLKKGLRGLYKTLELPGENPLKNAHKKLDEAVAAAYGFSMKKDTLGQLLKLNLTVAALVSKRSDVVPPGIPPGFKNRKSILSKDCISL